MIQAIILAAGRSTRMGKQKLLMPFNGIRNDDDRICDKNRLILRI